MIENFGLHEKAQREAVEIVLTPDREKITGAKKARMTVAGFIIVDINTIDPEDGELMFVVSRGEADDVTELKNIKHLGIMQWQRR